MICVCELNGGSGEVGSEAALASGNTQLKVELENQHTSSIVELETHAMFSLKKTTECLA